MVNVGRIPGQTDDEYRRYLKLVQGEEARSAANAAGVDTSGQYWDGSKFKPMDAGPMKFIAEHPAVGMGIAMAPALFAGGGGGLIHGLKSVFSLGGGGGGTAASASAGAASTGGGGMGLLNTINNIMQFVGPAFGKAADSRAQSLMAAEQGQLSRDALDLRGRELNAALPGQRLSTAARASLASGGPFKLSFGGPGSGKFTASGGQMNPLSPDAQALADTIMKQQLSAQLRGDEWSPTPAPQAGTMDHVLPWLAAGTSGWDMLRRAGLRRPTVGADGADGTQDW